MLNQKVSMKLKMNQTLILEVYDSFLSYYSVVSEKMYSENSLKNVCYNFLLKSQVLRPLAFFQIFADKYMFQKIFINSFHYKSKILW